MEWMLIAVSLVGGMTPEIEVERFPTLEACRQAVEVLSEMVSQMPEAKGIPLNTRCIEVPRRDGGL